MVPVTLSLGIPQGRLEGPVRAESELLRFVSRSETMVLSSLLMIIGRSWSSASPISRQTKNQVRTVPILVSVTICTWNRAAILDRTLESFRSLRVPDGVEWELLLVDNNCTDETPEVARCHAVHLPLRLLVEPVQGVSIARNCA